MTCSNAVVIWNHLPTTPPPHRRGRVGIVNFQFPAMSNKPQRQGTNWRSKLCSSPCHSQAKTPAIWMLMAKPCYFLYTAGIIRNTNAPNFARLSPTLSSSLGGEGGGLVTNDSRFHIARLSFLHDMAGLCGCLMILRRAGLLFERSQIQTPLASRCVFEQDTFNCH